MRGFHLLLLAVTAHAAPGPIAERDEIISTGDVPLAIIKPFEPWPGYFKGKGANGAWSLQKRSPDTTAVCNAARPSYRSRGWVLDQAACSLSDPYRRLFYVRCVSPINPYFTSNNLWGRCRHNEMCIDIHAQNGIGMAAIDIICIPRASFREWFIQSILAEHGLACSPYYINNVAGYQAVNMSLEINVVDSHKKNRIAPASVYYLLDGKTKIGVERAFDADVGSGVITLPHGSKVQACVQAVIGQVLWASVSLTALALVPSKS